MWDELASKYISQNPDTPARTIEGEAIVITPHDSTLHTLNGTATFIWDHADGTKTLGQITEQLLTTYEVEEDVAREDALAFVQEAVAKGLILTGDEPMPLP